MSQYLNYTADDMRQRAILAELPMIRRARESCTFHIDERTVAFRSIENPNRLYVISGLMRHTFGDSKRYWGDTVDLNYIYAVDRKHYLSDANNLKDYKPVKVDCIVRLEDKHNVNDGFLLSNTLFNIFENKRYLANNRKIPSMYFMCNL